MTEYEALFKRFQELKWLNDPFGIFIHWHLQSRFGAKLQEELAGLHKSLFPRRKRVNYNNLPQDQVEAIRGKWAQEALAYLEERAQEFAEVKGELDQLAPTIELIPAEEESRLEESPFSVYRSQGLGMKKYTRQALAPREKLLIENGFSARVEETALGFELWSNAQAWQLDALQRRAKADLLSWAVACWHRGVNPKVYNPFLSQDIFDKSLELWREEQGCGGARDRTLEIPVSAVNDRQLKQAACGGCPCKPG